MNGSVWGPDCEVPLIMVLGSTLNLTIACEIELKNGRIWRCALLGQFHSVCSVVEGNQLLPGSVNLWLLWKLDEKVLGVHALLPIKYWQVSTGVEWFVGWISQIKWHAKFCGLDGSFYWHSQLVFESEEGILRVSFISIVQWWQHQDCFKCFWWPCEENFGNLQIDGGTIQSQNDAACSTLHDLWRTCGTSHTGNKV